MIHNCRTAIIILLGVSSFAQPVFEPQIYSVEVTSKVKLHYCQTTILCKVDNQNLDSQKANYSIILPESSFISNVSVIDRDNVFTGHIISENEIPGNEDNERNWNIPDLTAIPLSLSGDNIYFISMLVKPFSNLIFNLTYEHPIIRELGEYSIPINLFLDKVIPKLRVEVIINETNPLKFIKLYDFYERTFEDLKTHNSSATINWSSHSANYARVVWAPSKEEQRKLRSKNGQLLVKYDTIPENRILLVSQWQTGNCSNFQRCLPTSSGDSCVPNSDRPIVQISVQHDDTGSQFQLTTDGYFIHKFTKNDFEPLKKHVTFVLDVSESMEGHKIRQLKKAMHGILDTLSAKDKFSLIFYSSKMKVWTGSGSCSRVTSSIVNVTPDVIRESDIRNINRAKGCVTQIRSAGGTFTFEALVHAFNISSLVKTLYPNSNLLIILLTDGKPNGIVSNKTQIVSRIMEMNKHLNVSLYSLGFGQDVDFSFLKSLSLKNRGFARRIRDTDNASDQIKNFYKSVSSLLLSNVRFVYGDNQVNTSTLSKPEFYNYFDGTSLMTVGETQKNLRQPLRGTLYSDQTSVDQTEISQADDETSYSLKRISHYLRIQELLDKADVRSKREAVDLAKLNNFAIPSTYMVMRKSQGDEYGEAKMIIGGG